MWPLLTDTVHHVPLIWVISDAPLKKKNLCVMQSLEFLPQATSGHLYNIRAAAVFIFPKLCILTFDSLSTY